MAFNYASSQATAERLIESFGQSASIRRVALSGDSWAPTQTNTDHACTVVVLDYSHAERAGTSVQSKDRKVLVSTDGLSIEPTPADKFILGAVVYEIVTVKPLNPGGTVVLYELQARA